MYIHNLLFIRIWSKKYNFSTRTLPYDQHTQQTQGTPKLYAKKSEKLGEIDFELRR